jgi:anti-anti-sigma factor
MPEPHNEHLLELEAKDCATVVRFKRRTILDHAAIEAISNQLLSLCRQKGQLSLVLNFAGVESLTSAMLGEFMVLHRTLGEMGGQLVFCCVDPFLLQVFKIVKIPDHIPIVRDESQAIERLAAEPK